MKKIIYTFYCCFLICVYESNAQLNTIKKANKLYSSMSYFEAIPEYEKALSKDSNNNEVLSKLGNCYRLTNNVKGELICYGKLVKTGQANSLQKLYYGQALMSKKGYQEAKKYMDEYVDDNRGKMFSKSISNIKVYYKNEDAYKINPVSFNSEENDFSPVISKDNKIIFTSARSTAQWVNRKHNWTGKNFYYLYSTEKNKNGEFKNPKLYSKVFQSKYNDGPICFSYDGTTVYFTRNDLRGKKVEKSSDGTIKLKIYEASVTKKNKFENVKELPFNNKEYAFAHPAISPDGNTIYFSSDMPGTIGGMDLWKSSKQKDGTWSKPENCGDKINTKGNELFPFITKENVMYYSSNGLDGIGGLDIYEVKIKEGNFGKVYNMGSPINSSADDFGIVFNNELKGGFFSSNRTNEDLNDDIFEFSIIKPIKRGLVLNLKTKDKNTGDILPNTIINFCGNNYTSDEKGELQIDLEENTNCELIAKHDNYFDAKQTISPVGNDSDLSEINLDILLDKNLGFSLFALITDAKDKNPLEGVKMKITDENGNIIEHLTPATGDYKSILENKKLGDNVKYKIELSKTGYVNKTIEFNKKLITPGEQRLNDSLDLSLSKLEVGGDIGKMINIKPIYFDVNKFNIRPDAAIELDKIVKVMTEYPQMKVELGSHTDCRSSAAYNAALSEKRAKASADYIKKFITNPERIYGKGYGESKLKNNCACEGSVKSTCSDAEHQENRRTEFIIIKL